MQHAILPFTRAQSTLWGDVIDYHFKRSANSILEVVQEWTNQENATSNDVDEYEDYMYRGSRVALTASVAELQTAMRKYGGDIEIKFQAPPPKDPNAKPRASNRWLALQAAVAVQHATSITEPDTSPSSPTTPFAGTSLFEVKPQPQASTPLLPHSQLFPHLQPQWSPLSSLPPPPVAGPPPGFAMPVRGGRGIGAGRGNGAGRGADALTPSNPFAGPGRTLDLSEAPITLGRGMLSPYMFPSGTLNELSGAGVPSALPGRGGRGGAPNPPHRGARGGGRGRGL